MTFTKDSRTVKSMIILLLNGDITYDEIPDLGNLKNVVSEALTSK